MDACERDVFRLSTGRCLYANQYLLCPHAMSGDLMQGYDGHAVVWTEGDTRDTYVRLGVLTLAERREIALYMLAQWIAWANREEEADVAG